MTKIELKGNAEYAAQVVEVKTLNTYEGLDNLKGLPLNGMTALVFVNRQVTSSPGAIVVIETKFAPNVAVAPTLQAMVSRPQPKFGSVRAVGRVSAKV